MDTRGSWRWGIVPIVMLMILGAAAEEVPEVELLEFLSDWQDENGAMLEPRMFDEDPEAESEEDVGESNASE
jgi:hypothetical protein